MRLGKKEATGYVADIETDEIPDTLTVSAVSSQAASEVPVASPATESATESATAATGRPEEAATAS